MGKSEKLDFDQFESLFKGEGINKDEFSDEKLLSVIRNPSSLKEIPDAQKLNFWAFVAERMVESPKFKEEVAEAVAELKEKYLT